MKNLNILLRIRMIIYTLFCVGSYGYYALFVQGYGVTYPIKAEHKQIASAEIDMLNNIK